METTIFGGVTRGSSGILIGGDRVDCGGGNHPFCSDDCSGSTSSSGTRIKEIRSGIEMGSVKGSGCDCNFYQVTQNTNPLLQRTPTAPSQQYHNFYNDS